MTSASNVDAAFAALLNSLACPACGDHYTDAAVQWCFGYIAGRHDLLVEDEKTERDGPAKIRCATCNAKSVVNYFDRSVSLTE